MGADLASSLVDGKRFRRPNFRMTFLSRKFLITFLSHQPYFVSLVLIFTVKKCIHDTFLSQFVLCHTFNNTISRNIEGADAWTVPHLKFWGIVHLSLRP